MTQTVPAQFQVDVPMADVCQLPLPESTPWSDATVLPAAYEVAIPYVLAALREYGKQLPPVRSEEWLDAPDSVKVATILAAGCAWLVTDPHRTVRNLLKEASDDVHGGDAERWRRTAAEHVPFDELQARRARASYPVAERAA